MFKFLRFGPAKKSAPIKNSDSMNILRNLASVIGAILKYAPVIIVIVEALTTVKDAIDKLNKKEQAANTAPAVPSLTVLPVEKENDN